jgi:hypothetical protein
MCRRSVILARHIYELVSAADRITGSPMSAPAQCPPLGAGLPAVRLTLFDEGIDHDAEHSRTRSVVYRRGHEANRSGWVANVTSNPRARSGRAGCADTA